MVEKWSSGRSVSEPWGWLQTPSWHEQAACRDYPQEVFFGEEYLGERQRHRPTLTAIEIREAKKVCAQCPVLYECFTHAVENEEEYGVWGGTTHKERKRILAQSSDAA